MPFNSIISKAKADPLIPQEVSAELLNQIVTTNPVMTLGRRLQNLSAAQRRMPVLDSLATAYFVTGVTGLKQTTDVSWTDKYIDAEEVAAIVPIPQSVLDDADYDIWGQVKPALVQAFNRAIVAAVLYGTNIPATWTVNMGAHAGICALATAHSSSISAAAYSDMYEAILGETDAGTDGVFMLVEADGFGVTGSIAHISMKGKLRNTRDSQGLPIFKTNMQDPTRYELDGTPIFFPLDGSIVPASSLLISGDWSQLVYAVRQDMTYSIATEGVITDAGGNIVYNLFQQDMVALRAVMRLGFALPNPINAMQETVGSRSPFAVLVA